MDGTVDETQYHNTTIQEILRIIERDFISPEERARMKDEYSFEALKQDEFQKGLAEGEIKGKILMLKRQLTYRFGALPDWAITRIESADIEQLEMWAEKIFDIVHIDALIN
jgi:hypothetical protein